MHSIKERLLCISDTSARKLITAFFTFRIFQVDYLTKRILFIQSVIVNSHISRKRTVFVFCYVKLSAVSARRRYLLAASEVNNCIEHKYVDVLRSVIAYLIVYQRQIFALEHSV